MCLVSRVELLGLAGPVVDVGDVPDVVRGEVLVDSRGQGSFQVVAVSGREKLG